MFLISGFINQRIVRQFFKENDIECLIELYYASIRGDFLTIVSGILFFYSSAPNHGKSAGVRLRKQRKIACFLYLLNLSLPSQTNKQSSSVFLRDNQSPAQNQSSPDSIGIFTFPLSALAARNQKNIAQCNRFHKAIVVAAPI